MKREALKAAFPYTIPIFAGFWFLALAYGIYMNTAGFSFIYPMFMSVLIYGGSLEFIAVEMLLSPFAPVQVLIMALLVQARHLFYGISMLEKYKGMGWKKFYLIFGMCDETFSINYTAHIPDNVDKGWFMLWVTALNQFYWFTAATLGGILGSFLSFSTKGLDFVMTAMFTVIFLEQWLKERAHHASVIGLGSTIVSLAVFGPEKFMLPAMALILLCLALFKKPVERGLAE